jgi:hypothetical protein
MLNIDSEKLNQMETEGKVRTMLAVGNRKLYLLSSFQDQIPVAKKEKSLAAKFLSWLGFK